MLDFPSFNPDPSTQQQFLNRVVTAIETLRSEVTELRTEVETLKLKEQKTNNTVQSDEFKV